MESLLLLLPALGCGLVMLACMAMMGWGMRGPRRQEAARPPEAATAQEVAALREEVARLRAEQEDPDRVDD